MKIEHSTRDKSINIVLEYKQGYPFKRTPYGKSWPKSTNGVIIINGFTKATHTVTKHEKDPDNLKIAIVNVTKVLLEQISLKWLRKEIWTKVFTKIEELENKNTENDNV